MHCRAKRVHSNIFLQYRGMSFSYFGYYDEGLFMDSVNYPTSPVTPPIVQQQEERGFITARDLLAEQRHTLKRSRSKIFDDDAGVAEAVHQRATRQRIDTLISESKILQKIMAETLDELERLMTKAEGLINEL